jgi:hypothetical protein
VQRRLVVPVAVALAALLAPLAAASGLVSGGVPDVALPTTATGWASFNQPGANPFRIADAETAIIAAAVPGSAVNASIYRSNSGPLVRALVAAAKRGVHVQVLVDGGLRVQGCGRTAPPDCTGRAYHRLERLNTLHLTDPYTWLRTCDGIGPDHLQPTGVGHGCLGQGLDHNKFVLANEVANRSGTVTHDVVFQTSSNDGIFSYFHAFNNGLLLTNPRLYKDYLGYFDHLVHASGSKLPAAKQRFTHSTGDRVDSRTLAQHDLETFSFPRAPSDDPVARVLHRVDPRSCIGSDVVPPASIDAAIFAVSGRPAIMRNLVALRDAGCSVTLAYTTISADDYRLLHRSRVRLQRVCVRAPNYTGRGSPTQVQYVHSKYLLIDGHDTTLGRGLRKIVYTGSENWTAEALSRSDDRMVRYVESTSDDPVFRQYFSNFHNVMTSAVSGPMVQTSTCASTNG